MIALVNLICIEDPLVVMGNGTARTTDYAKGSAHIMFITVGLCSNVYCNFWAKCFAHFRNFHFVSPLSFDSSTSSEMQKHVWLHILLRFIVEHNLLRFTPINEQPTRVRFGVITC